MATVENSLQITDGATSVLKRVSGSLQITTGLMKSLKMASSDVLALPGVQMWESSLAGVKVQYERVEETITQVKKKQTKLSESTKDQEKQTLKLKEAWDKVSSVMKKAGITTSPMDIFKQANDVKAAGNIIQTKTGMQGADLKDAKNSASNLYIDNLSPSLDSAAESLSAVHQLTGQTGSGLEQITHAGLLLQDTFGYGLTDSIKSAGVLEQQFGISGAEAFDLIVQGSQAGLNKNGDLLDSINQYSSKFKSLGLAGNEMFNVLINGAQNSGLSVSSLGDAVSEFSKRAVSGGSESSQGFSALGLDAGKMTEAFQSGGESAKQAFQQTMAALSSMEDPVSRNAAGVKLFGDEWGKIGSSGVTALSDLNGSVELTKDNLEELNSLKYDDASSALGSLVKTINIGLASPMGGLVNAVTNSINDLTAGLQGKVENISGIFGIIGLVAGKIGGYISDSWSVFEPVIWGIVAALIAYNAVLGIGWLTMLKNAATTAWDTVCNWANTAALTAQKIAMEGLNAAFAACPLTWIIILIIMLIALFYAGVAAVNQFAGTSYSATGIIFGAFAAVFAAIGNILMGFLEMVFGVVELLVNPFIAFANFLANLFQDPLTSIVYLFADLADSVLGFIQKIAKTIDLVFGTKMEATVKVWRENASNAVEDFVKKHGNGTYEKKFDPLDLDKSMEKYANFSTDHIDYGESYKKWYGTGTNLEDKAKDKLGDFKGIFSGQNTDAYAPPTNDEIINNTANTAANTAAMSDSMDAMDEELKYMRDAAEQEIINRFTLAELKVDVNNNNNIKNVTDFDELNRRLSNVTGEILSSAAEGVG